MNLNAEIEQSMERPLQSMKNQLHISLYASSSARRSALSNLIRKNFKAAVIKVITSLGLLRHPLSETAMEILIADLGTPSEAAALLRFLDNSPGTLGVVALIDDPEPRWVVAALSAETHAIISREPNSEEFRLAIAAAEAGLVLLHRSSARNLTARNFQPSVFLNDMEELTEREREVLCLLANGLGNKQIAARLAISEHTAKFHISSILGKLSVASRTEAVSQGIKMGLIPI
jgi:NarL family two-component system response regulator YdfI